MTKLEELAVRIETIAECEDECRRARWASDARVRLAERREHFERTLGWFLEDEIRAYGT